MPENQEPKNDVEIVDGEKENAKTEQSRTALAEAVARRNEAHKLSNQSAGRASHGGKPYSNLKVSDQTRGKRS